MTPNQCCQFLLLPEMRSETRQSGIFQSSTWQTLTPTEGEQNRPPQNYTTLVYGLFWAKGNQDPGDSRKTSTSPLSTLKYIQIYIIDWGPGPERLWPEITFDLKDLLVEAWQGKHLITKHLLFYLWVVLFPFEAPGSYSIF